MTKPAELEAKFCKALISDRTMMLGISGVDESHTRPMTAQLEGDEGGSNLVLHRQGQRLGAAASRRRRRGCDLSPRITPFSVHGSLRVDTERDVVDRLWNRFVAAWYEQGKDEPKLALLRLDSDAGQAGPTLRVSWRGLDPKRTTRTRSQRSPWARKATNRVGRRATAGQTEEDVLTVDRLGKALLSRCSDSATCRLILTRNDTEGLSAAATLAQALPR
jgi:hypothetical protein